jgi:hypothetical protein
MSLGGAGDPASPAEVKDGPARVEDGRQDLRVGGEAKRRGDGQAPAVARGDQPGAGL